MSTQQDCDGSSNYILLFAHQTTWYFSFSLPTASLNCVLYEDYMISYVFLIFFTRFLSTGSQ